MTRRYERDGISTAKVVIASTIIGGANLLLPARYPILGGVGDRNHLDTASAYLDTHRNADPATSENDFGFASRRCRRLPGGGPGRSR